MTARMIIAAATLVLLCCLSGSADALMARVTCHCDIGDIPGETSNSVTMLHTLASRCGQAVMD